MTAPLQALTDTARTYLVGNLLPMIGNVLQGIPQVIYGLVPEVVQTGTELLGSLAQGFTQGIPDFLANALPQLLSFTENLRENAGEFVNAGLDMITQLANGLIAGLPDLIAYVPDIIINICGIINDNMPKLLAEGVSLVVQLGVGIVKGCARPAGQLEEDPSGRVIGHFCSELAEHRQEHSHRCGKRRQEHGLFHAECLQGWFFPVL